MLAGDFYWSRVPVESGQIFQLAGWDPLPGGMASEAFIHKLLGAPSDGVLVVYADPRRGIFRYASVVDGKLDACLYLGRSESNLPERGALAQLLGQTVAAEARPFLVAACQPVAGADSSTGPIVCACFAVGLAAIRNAITAQCATTHTEIGALLRAGTNCGSCIPELKEILRNVHDEAREGAVA
jgi:assimilatory nitrate reductase catalytic subunit